MEFWNLDFYLDSRFSHSLSHQTKQNKKQCGNGSKWCPSCPVFFYLLPGCFSAHEDSCHHTIFLLICSEVGIYFFLWTVLTQCVFVLLCGEAWEVWVQTLWIYIPPRILHKYRSHSQASLDSSSGLSSPSQWYQLCQPTFGFPPRWLTASSRSSQMPYWSPALHPSPPSADKSWRRVSALHCRKSLSFE